ncbi:hypothetical protein EDD18DRAFT_1104573 [Armillaria luteobubalina]|uniref:Uncharacterized protein n=1 Tax=Armillaria luteobubalina TaxID=153913 RepID=A0AA39Q6E0_9AGAR|nr:hypothetical protein EDD18DRAFT_1104573 [Armillaria luteobubalina]
MSHYVSLAIDFCKKNSDGVYWILSARHSRLRASFITRNPPPPSRFHCLQLTSSLPLAKQLSFIVHHSVSEGSLTDLPEANAVMLLFAARGNTRPRCLLQGLEESVKQEIYIYPAYYKSFFCSRVKRSCFAFHVCLLLLPFFDPMKRRHSHLSDSLSDEGHDIESSNLYGRPTESLAHFRERMKVKRQKTAHSLTALEISGSRRSSFSDSHAAGSIPSSSLSDNARFDFSSATQALEASGSEQSSLNNSHAAVHSSTPKSPHSITTRIDENASKENEDGRSDGSSETCSSASTYEDGAVVKSEQEDGEWPLSNNLASTLTTDAFTRCVLSKQKLFPERIVQLSGPPSVPRNCLAANADIAGKGGTISEPAQAER